MMLSKHAMMARKWWALETDLISMMLPPVDLLCAAVKIDVMIFYSLQIDSHLAKSNESRPVISYVPTQPSTIEK